MTERKPPFVTFETWVDKQIREATERGEFDDLPGAGRPLSDQGKPYHEMWWVKQKLRDEELSGEALLPTSVRLRKEIERLPDTVRDLPSEQAVRAAVKDLNTRIAETLRAPSGPQVQIRPVQVDTVVRQWREDRRLAMRQPVLPDSAARDETPPARTRWWQRITRRHR